MLDAASHGNLLRGFVAADSAEQMLLFDDLSLHYFQKNKRLWQREEALSQIMQVEVFDSSLAAEASDAAELEQMRKM